MKYTSLELRTFLVLVGGEVTLFGSQHTPHWSPRLDTELWLAESWVCQVTDVRGFLEVFITTHHQKAVSSGNPGLWLVLLKEHWPLIGQQGLTCLLLMRYNYHKLFLSPRSQQVGTWENEMISSNWVMHLSHNILLAPDFPLIMPWLIIMRPQTCSSNEPLCEPCTEKRMAMMIREMPRVYQSPIMLLSREN